jgi:DmsE family decaheme c-type cytochrome
LRIRAQGSADVPVEEALMPQSRLAMPLAGLFVLLGGLASAQEAAPPAAWSVSDCQSCHEQALTPAFNTSSHGQAAQSCTNCHRNVAEHARAQMAGEEGPVPSLKNLDPNEINVTCLSCHEKANQASFDSSMHARRNVSCNSCHSVHHPKSTRSLLKTRNDSETCYTCHQTVRAKAMRTSHHPVREGKMSCASCHDPHDGARPKMIRADSVNELCYKCHTEKRGPFLFEHAPVREDCASCHEPHGSSHKRLLVQKLPNLCWNCHFTGSGHFGSGDNLSTELGARVAPAGAPTGFPTANSRFVEKSCKNCHANLHGSNSPSGAYFVR